MNIKLKMEPKKKKFQKQDRRYYQLLRFLKMNYLNNGGSKGEWKKWADDHSVYYYLKTYLNEITTEKDVEDILNGIYVSKGGTK